jgi:hypothetical protein
MTDPTPARPAAPGIDWSLMAAAIDGLQESLRACVARLIADGFTDDQARAITTAVFTAARR